jgi:NAD+--asparagine ADP-ribosyltransferase
MSQKSIKYIDYIEEKRIQQNEECKLKDRNDQIQKIMITSESFYNMINNQSYKVLAKIIDIYLGNTINFEKYFNHFRWFNDNCLKVFEEMNVLKYFNEKNKQRLLLKKVIKN